MFSDTIMVIKMKKVIYFGKKMFIGHIQNTNVLHTTNNIVFRVYETNTINKMVLVRVIIFLIINKTV